MPRLALAFLATASAAAVALTLVQVQISDPASAPGETIVHPAPDAAPSDSMHLGH